MRVQRHATLVGLYWCCKVSSCYFHFPGVWTSLAALNGNLGNAKAHDDTFLGSTASIPTPTGLLSAIATEPITENNVFANVCDIEDSDLFFVLQEFPPPHHIISRASWSASSSQHPDETMDQVREVRPRKSTSMAVFRQGGWDNLSSNATLSALSPGDASTLPRDVASFMAAASTPHASTHAAWNAVVVTVTSQSPTNCLPQKSSLHERLELLLRGHTMRRRSPLWISMESIRSMKLAVVPSITWFRYDFTNACVEQRLVSSFLHRRETIKCNGLTTISCLEVQNVVRGTVKVDCEPKREPRTVKRSRVVNPVVVVPLTPIPEKSPKVCVTLEDILPTCSKRNNDS